jgi:hypothetical protein
MIEEDQMVRQCSTAEERTLDMINRILSDLDALEKDIEEAEDRLGLPRSSASDPWNERVRRLRDAAERA